MILVKRKYDANLLKLMTLFETKTRVRLKDAFEDNFGLLYFVVNKGTLGKALGKNAANAKWLSAHLKKKVKFIEFNEERETFIKRMLFPLKIESIETNEDVVTLKGVDTETNSIIIGRSGTNLRNYENIVKRYFTLDEIKVVK